MSEVVIQCDKLSKEFLRGQTRVVALDAVDMAFHRGEFHALMGPSGSGKSTLLHLIAGIDKPTAGTLTVLGQRPAEMGEHDLARWRNAHVGFVFQAFNLIPVLTAVENVELPLKLTKLNRSERRDHAMTALKLVGLADRVTHFPRQLSGGQEQRVALARALVTDPDLILADEPTGNLDAASAHEVLGLLDRLNEEFGKTIVMVTHDPNAAAAAKKIHHLDKGKLATKELSSPGRDGYVDTAEPVRGG
ncbi:MAG: ABC transporter ATP-binding protein [Tepidisphaeraceae bacterium]|jgi:putative ABC transport system ATP-binding protein